MRQKTHDFIGNGGLKLTMATILFILSTVTFAGTFSNLKKNQQVLNQMVRYLQKGCDGN